MRLLIILFALALSACATSPQPVTPQKATGGFQVFGTLSSSDNPIEMQASVVYSSLARLFYNADARLNDGRMTVDQAKQVDRTGSQILADLDSAVLSRNADAIGRTAQQVKEAHQQMEEWE